MDNLKMAYIDRMNTDKEIYEKTIAGIQKGIKQRESVKTYLEDISKPNPTSITVITVLLLLAIYFAYLYFVKDSPAGQWLDDGDSVWTISYKQFTDEIRLTNGDNKGELVGKLSGKSMVFSNGFIGIWKSAAEIELYHDGDLLLTLKKIK